MAWLRAFLSFVVLGFAIIGYATAIAAPKSPRDICPALGENLENLDLVFLRFTVRESDTAKHDSLLRAVKLEIDPSGQLLGPVYSDKRNAILIPQRFFIRQCKMVQLQYAVVSKPKFDVASFGEVLDRCVEQPRDGARCMESTIDGFIDKMPNYSTDTDFAQERLVIVATTYNAVRFFMAHETAHLVMRRTMGAALENIDEEAEADLRAQVGITANISLPIGPILSLATMTFLDSTVTDPSHPSAACRLLTTRMLMLKTLPVLSLAKQLREFKPFSSIGAEADLKTLETFKPMTRDNPRESCDTLDPKTLASIDRDLRSTRALLDFIASAEKGPEYNTGLLQYWRKTDASAQWSGRLNATIAMSSLLRDGNVLKFMAASPKGVAAVADTLKNLSDVSSFLSMAETKTNANMTPSDLSDLMFMRAMLEFYAQPKGSSAAKNFTLLKTRLDESFARSDLVETLRLNRHTLARLGDNAVGNPFAAMVMVTSLSKIITYAIAELPTVDCSNDQTRSGLTFVRATSAMTGDIPPFSRDVCESMKADFAKIPQSLEWAP